MQTGRPSSYSKELVDSICQEIMLGKSLRKICELEGMPVMSTICLWLLNHKDFSEQYARAREIQAEIQADEIVDISDDSRNDTQEVEGFKVTNYDNIQRSRLRVDARKWVAVKLLSKKYGDKIQHTNIDATNLSKLTPEELDKLRELTEKMAD